MTSVVLTGATGFVGGEVLRQLGERDDVRDVTCLSRRPVGTASSKVQTVLLTDFSRYDDDLAAHFAEHEACLWCLGGKASDAANPEAYLHATYTFTLAFARAVAPRLSRPFRFCYVSGMGADPTESATLPWEKTTRHLKGRVERHLEELTREHPLFRVTSFRPAGILPRDSSSVMTTLLAPLVIRVDRLASAMIDEGVRPSTEAFAVVPNAEIKRRSRSTHQR